MKNQDDVSSGEISYQPEQLFLWRPETIRSRCQQILNKAKQGELKAYQYFPEKLCIVADYVIQVIRENYPDFEVPPHSRWRHFAAGHQDRWSPIVNQIKTDKERQHCATELTIISVLLDAGAGDHWIYTEQETGLVFSRSEGLAIASLALYASGKLSSKGTPYQVDAKGLTKLKVDDLAEVF